eukprot:7983069-Heterocapsa_arctica.AAC.1
MVEDLQRQLSSHEDLYDNQPPKGHPIPVFPLGTGPVGSFRNEEAASGSGGDIPAMVAKAVAAAFSSY